MFSCFINLISIFHKPCTQTLINISSYRFYCLIRMLLWKLLHRQQLPMINSGPRKITSWCWYQGDKLTSNVLFSITICTSYKKKSIVWNFDIFWHNSRLEAWSKFQTLNISSSNITFARIAICKLGVILLVIDLAVTFESNGVFNNCYLTY